MCFCEVGDFQCRSKINYHTCPSIKAKIFVCNGQKQTEANTSIVVLKITQAIAEDRRGLFSSHVAQAREANSSDDDWNDFHPD